MRFVFPRADEARQLKIFDVSGAQRWSGKIARGEEGMEWRGTDASGRALPAGVYFAKLRDPHGEQQTRVVLMP